MKLTSILHIPLPDHHPPPPSNQDQRMGQMFEILLNMYITYLILKKITDCIHIVIHLYLVIIHKSYSDKIFTAFLLKCLDKHLEFCLLEFPSAFGL